jgi:hypothetical protein
MIERKHFELLGVVGRIVLKCIFRQLDEETFYSTDLAEQRKRWWMLVNG